MKWLVHACLALALLAAGATAARADAYQLSTHILDITRGKPVPGVEIILFKIDTAKDIWVKVAEGRTDENGRVGNFLPGVGNDGTYKLRFEVAPYFKAHNEPSLYPFVEIIFAIEGAGHYHIPITMSANGYSTYRGN